MNKLFATIIALLLSATAMAQTYEQLVENAEKCAKSDSLAKAEELYKEALKQNPYKGSNALVFSNLGKVQEAQGKNKEALESYTYAINMAPSSVPLRLSRILPSAECLGQGSARLYLRARHQPKDEGGTSLSRLYLCKAKGTRQGKARLYRTLVYRAEPLRRRPRHGSAKRKTRKTSRGDRATYQHARCLSRKIRTLSGKG